LILLGAAVLSAVILAAWFPTSSIFHQRASLASASAQLSQLHQQDAALAQEKKNLSDSAEIVRIAREQYQLVSPGQRAFQVLPPTGAATASTPYAGDPGSIAPVAPSATTELPPGGVTTTTTLASPATAHSPGSPGATAKSGNSHPPNAIQRMLHALEFWR
jgi:cell division protein FtsB